jgi:hypothetical protein
MADNLTRSHITSFLETRKLQSWDHLVVPTVLSDWLKHPWEDKVLSFKLLKHVENNLKIKKINIPTLVLIF